MGIQTHHVPIIVAIAILVLAAGPAVAQDDAGFAVEGDVVDARGHDGLATVVGTGLVILTLVIVFGVPLARALRNVGGSDSGLLKVRRRYFETCRQRREAHAARHARPE